MQADLLAVLVFRETGIAMASQTLLVAHLGGVLRCSPNREQQGNTEDQTATLHVTPRLAAQSHAANTPRWLMKTCNGQ